MDTMADTMADFDRPNLQTILPETRTTMTADLLLPQIAKLHNSFFHMVVKYFMTKQQND